MCSEEDNSSETWTVGRKQFNSIVLTFFFFFLFLQKFVHLCSGGRWSFLEPIKVIGEVIDVGRS